MDKVVALIGTNHLFQIGGNPRVISENSDFELFLKLTCQRYKARILAEEMSLDALEMHGRKQSTVAAVAIDLGISHVYCDPSQVEQKNLRLCVERNAHLLHDFHGWTQERIDKAITREHQKRERFWRKRILDQNVWPVVFVCGSKHIKSFQSLLHTNDMCVHLVAKNWGVGR